MSDSHETRPLQRPPVAVGLTVLLAEDDANLRSMLSIVLRRDGHRVREFRDGADLDAELVHNYPEGRIRPENVLIVADMRMPAQDGLSVIRQLRRRGNQLPFILMTAFGDAQTHAAAWELGALAVLDKPFDFDDLRATIRAFARLSSS